MVLISESYTTEFGKNYSVTYKDKEIDIEEYCENGQNEINYNFHDNGIVSHTVEVDQNSSYFSTMYFHYIRKYGSIPAFSVSKNNKHNLKINMKDCVMDFEVDLSNDPGTTYLLNLGEYGAYVFDQNVMKEDFEYRSPYDMDIHLLMEIYFNDKRDKLLIVDWQQDEFYSIDSKYKLIFSGTTKLGDLKDYKQNDILYTYKYDKFGMLKSLTSSNSENDLSFVYENENEFTITYRIPYTVTSYGVIIPEDNEVLYETKFIHINEDEQELESTVRLLTKQESEGIFENFLTRNDISILD